MDEWWKMVAELVNAINKVSIDHKNFSENFYSTIIPMNLKKTRISDIVSECGQKYDTDFIHLYIKYIEAVNLHSLDYYLDVDKTKIEVRHRSKQKESALSKIHLYRVVKSGDGKYAIQKSLNDLFGIRLIIDTEIGYDELEEKIKSSADLQCKLFQTYVRTDGEYKALHMYIKGEGNSYFPWEIQIWRQSDESSNESSHALHKSKRTHIQSVIEY